MMAQGYALWCSVVHSVGWLNMVLPFGVSGSIPVSVTSPHAGVRTYRGVWTFNMDVGRSTRYCGGGWLPEATPTSHRVTSRPGSCLCGLGAKRPVFASAEYVGTVARSSRARIAGSPVSASSCGVEPSTSQQTKSKGIPMDKEQLRLRAIEIAADVFEHASTSELFSVALEIENYVTGVES